MKINTDPKKIDEVLTRGVEEVIVLFDLKKKMKSGKQLRVKLGIDPTGSDLHIGHAVPLRKLRQFQELGHKVILLIGDYTAMIGDPSGRDETRPILTKEQVKQNERTYIEQAGKVLDMSTVEVRHNSEWYNIPEFTGFIMELTSKITVARVLERDDFQKRLREGSDIQMQEIMYPLLQGYDSVALEADIEIGGTDQKFNLLMGRKIQKKYNQVKQDVVTVPLLEGVDGHKKMSKTYNNYISLTDTPEDVFGKTMSIPDDLIIKYFEMATAETMARIDEYKNKLNSGINPRDIKMILARSLTELYCGKEGVNKGEQHFISVIQSKDKPDEIPEIKPSAYDIVTVLVESGLVKGTSDARRNITQGGVKVNDKKIEDIKTEVKAGDLVQKGKRFFVRIV
ncbi:MAG: tyrosine--tRNA ligase [Parcubacteria group bacterium]|nr:tyrosine--tRNA ligase [Parcubacteria group bacterium]